MRKLLLGFLLGALFLGSTALAADRPAVLQPNAPAYSSAELAVLLPAMARLETLLRDSALGSRRYLASDDWQSLNFARYTAGVLAERGYDTRLASSAGWPDGVHTWVLVGIPLPGKTAWVPVEASPEAGHSQPILGYVPESTDSAGRAAFPEKYVAFSAVAELPPNLPPVAAIRVPPLSMAQKDQTVEFLGLGSRDPDGQIVLYQWDFGDGEAAVTTAPVAEHVFAARGTYTVSLTVIDAGGKSAATSVAFTVTSAATGEGPSSPPSAGCGCGKP